MIDARLVIAAVVFYIGVNAAVGALKAGTHFTIPEGKALHCAVVDKQ